jgi:ankyrin repeat protein
MGNFRDDRPLNDVGSKSSTLQFTLLLSTMTRLLTTLVPLLLLSSLAAAVRASDDAVVTTEFLDACTHAKMDIVQASIEEHPGWLNGRSESGETCLHVAGIIGQPEVSRYLLKKGADVNIRSSYEGGLRMHPLSWNVYGGHYENIEVLVVEFKAGVNHDFDDSKGKPITCLDTVLNTLSSEDKSKPDDEYYGKFRRIKDLLLMYGAKQYKDLVADTTTEEAGL